MRWHPFCGVQLCRFHRINELPVLTARFKSMFPPVVGYVVESAA